MYIIMSWYKGLTYKISILEERIKLVDTNMRFLSLIHGWLSELVALSELERYFRVYVVCNVTGT